MSVRYQLLRPVRWFMDGFWTWAPLLALCAGIVLAFYALTLRGALGEEAPTCPPPHKSCKIVAISPEDEAMLTNPNMILDMAEWASRPLYQYVRAWRDKLRDAPVRNTESPAAQSPPASGQQ